jgi:hypothetical protein
MFRPQAHPEPASRAETITCYHLSKQTLRCAIRTKGKTHTRMRNPYRSQHRSTLHLQECRSTQGNPYRGRSFIKTAHILMRNPYRHRHGPRSTASPRAARPIGNLLARPVACPHPMLHAPSRTAVTPSPKPTRATQGCTPAGQAAQRTTRLNERHYRSHTCVYISARARADTGSER